MLDLESLAVPNLLLAIESEERMDNAAWRMNRDGRVALIVRGWRCRTEERLFGEFAAALQFGWYFGKNWDAFEECISDLEWPPFDKASGVVIVVTDITQVLANDEERERKQAIFFSILARAPERFAEYSTQDRPGAQLKIVLHTRPEQRSEAEELLSRHKLLVRP